MSVENTFLDGICFAIESKYKGCVVGYEGFIDMNLQSSKQGMINIQVLNVSEEHCSEVRDYLFEIACELYERKKVDVSFNVWGKEQTEAYFLADYNRLMKNRNK